MFPIALDIDRLGIVVAGNGPATARRWRQLREAGAADLRLFALDPVAELAALSPARRWPAAADLAGARVMFVADLPADTAAELAAAGRQAGLLVNVEDKPALCDFHCAAQVRRGDLVVAVSTGGKSPGLAGAVRDRIGQMLGAEWGDRLDAMAAHRATLRAGGAEGAALAAAMTEFMTGQNWPGSKGEEDVGSGGTD